ncbi:MAG: hypothetical protein H6Q68_2560 [Firmicutes bacterium]|nr:hypothetical protein [Bacillota bacterium]
MLRIENITNLEELVGKKIDFFLEDDMFELTGIVRKENNSYSMEIIVAIDHIFKMIGKSLDMSLRHQKVYLRKVDIQKEYEICINRVYDTLTNPRKEEFCAIVADDIHEIYKSGDYEADDVIVSYDDNEYKWKLSYFWEGVPREYTNSYDTLEALYEDNLNIMDGKWEKTYYLGEWG